MLQTSILHFLRFSIFWLLVGATGWYWVARSCAATCFSLSWGRRSLSTRSISRILKIQKILISYVSINIRVLIFWCNSNLRTEVGSCALSTDIGEAPPSSLLFEGFVGVTPSGLAFGPVSDQSPRNRKRYRFDAITLNV